MRGARGLIRVALSLLVSPSARCSGPVTAAPLGQPPNSSTSAVRVELTAATVRMRGSFGDGCRICGSGPGFARAWSRFSQKEKNCVPMTLPISSRVWRSTTSRRGRSPRMWMTGLCLRGIGAWWAPARSSAGATGTPTARQEDNWGSNRPVSGGCFVKRGQVAPLVGLVQRMLVVGGVSRIDLSAAVGRPAGLGADPLSVHVPTMPRMGDAGANWAGDWRAALPAGKVVASLSGAATARPVRACCPLPETSDLGGASR